MPHVIVPTLLFAVAITAGLLMVKGLRGVPDAMQVERRVIVIATAVVFLLFSTVAVYAVIHPKYDDFTQYGLAIACVSLSALGFSLMAVVLWASTRVKRQAHGDRPAANG